MLSPRGLVSTQRASPAQQAGELTRRAQQAGKLTRRAQQAGELTRRAQQARELTRRAQQARELTRQAQQADTIPVVHGRCCGVSWGRGCLAGQRPFRCEKNGTN